VNATALRAASNRFVNRVLAVSFEEQKQGFLFRVMAKRLVPRRREALEEMVKGE